jgi:hypothetical protein
MLLCSSGDKILGPGGQDFFFFFFFLLITKKTKVE